MDVAAADLSTWLADMDAALRGERDADVPCAGCTACCTSAQFVHVGPDEADALGHIPKALLFPAPGLPEGHVLMGYDERGHCPMFVDGRCSIYEHRPRTCRTYDCRVFPATGVDADKPAIAERAAEWRFEGDATDLRVAATSLRDDLSNPTQRAVQAVRVVIAARARPSRPAT